MKISYKKLWILLIEKEITPATLRKDLNIATGTMTKLRKNE
ncbi:MAG TPA: helix-turn-helix domain-containing protein, partial [Candidatus Pullichristensenella stercorigallinarum]|nr:helix-turn-helix domain-containing protein [Candidatus Pullichristensenella stercorigallinarum]